MSPTDKFLKISNASIMNMIQLTLVINTNDND